MEKDIEKNNVYVYVCVCARACVRVTEQKLTQYWKSTILQFEKKLKIKNKDRTSLVVQ